METKTTGDLYLDTVFDRKQRWIWTSNLESAGVAWVAPFTHGSCNLYPVPGSRFVRVVR